VKRLLVAAGSVCILGLCGYLVLTAPFTWSALHPSRDVADVGAPDIANGRSLFYAGSCGTCHASPGQPDETHLGGGLALTSGFGTFYMPNISSDQADGIGAWTVPQFVRAMREGVSPEGENDYPAFPYTSFQRMDANDLRDLLGYIKTLPPVAGKARDHDLKFPFTMRRGVGLWRLVFLDGKPLAPEAQKSAGWIRGRYLVEGPGHCAECHSPRDVAGAIVAGKRFSGAPDPEGHGYVPNITSDETGIGYWSQRELTDYLGSGLTPINLQSGGSMAAVITNLAKLSPEDRAGIAEYIKSVPAIDAPDAGAPEPNRTAVVQMLPASKTIAASPTAALTGATAANILYAVATKPLYLDRPAAGASGTGDGRLLPAAKLTVVARDGDWLQVKIDGWQQQGSDAAVYALEGQRILVAALGPAAAAKVARQTGVVDANTKLTWSQTSLTAWVDRDALSPDIAKVWDYGGALYSSSCGTCHALHPTNSFLANQWIGSLQAMKRFAALDDSQYRLLLAYLQFHSKDVGALPAGGAP